MEYLDFLSIRVSLYYYYEVLFISALQVSNGNLQMLIITFLSIRKLQTLVTLIKCHFLKTAFFSIKSG